MMLCSAFWEQTLGIRIVMQSENLGQTTIFDYLGQLLNSFELTWIFFKWIFK